MSSKLGKHLFSKQNLISSKTNKICSNVHDLVKDIQDGARILYGGISMCGFPGGITDALSQKGVKDLTIVCHNPTHENVGLGHLIQKRQIKKLIASFVGLHPSVQRDFLTGHIEIEMVSQGTLAERIRAGGAGIPAFYTPAGVGSLVETGGLPEKYDASGQIVKVSPGKPSRVFNGRKYVLEEAITGDFAIVRAKKGDRFGNLVFSKGSRNYNYVAAKAARVALAEVEELVDLGEIPPDEVHLPGIYINKIFQNPSPMKMAYSVRTNDDNLSEVDEGKTRIARRAALEFKDGMVVNLGIGIPNVASRYIDPGTEIIVHSDPGIIGLGPYPPPGEVDYDITNSGGETCTLLAGASCFGCEESFAMIRSGRVDLTMLGAMEVSQFGDLANWMVPGKIVTGMGGAMDLVTVPSMRVVACMEHNSKKGAPKIMEECTLPVTGQRCVDLIITEKAVFEVDHEAGLTLVEVAAGLTLEDIQKATGCAFRTGENLIEMRQI